MHVDELHCEELAKVFQHSIRYLARCFPSQDVGEFRATHTRMPASRSHLVLTGILGSDG